MTQQKRQPVEKQQTTQKPAEGVVQGGYQPATNERQKVNPPPKKP